MIHMIKKWKIFKKNWGKSIIQQQKTYLIWILKPSHTAKNTWQRFGNDSQN